MRTSLCKYAFFFREPQAEEVAWILIPEKDLVFCKTDENRKVVAIYAVVDQRREDLSMIRGL